MAIANPVSARTAAPKLGRLTALGPQEPWQVALLLPSAWDDFRQVLDRFDLDASLSGQGMVLRGRVYQRPTRSFDRCPRTTGNMVDADNRSIGFTVFGDSRRFVEQLTDVMPDVTLYGVLKRFGHQWWLTQPEIITDDYWLGRLRPVYPGKAHVIAPDTARERVFQFLKAAVPEAARWIVAELGAPGMSDPASKPVLPAIVESLLWAAHVPKTPEQGRLAQDSLERLAAKSALLKIRQAATSDVPSAFRTPAEVQPRLDALPFALTREQGTALNDILQDLRGQRPMRRLLNGETGSGKTAVFASAAAACVDGGGRVAILTPNSRVSLQIVDAIKGWWPDLDPVLVTGDTVDTNLEAARLLVGTTAMLHRPVGPLSLVVIDEQQKFSRDQREQLTADGAHRLEASATCIPRSQALVRYGSTTVSRLARGPVRKHIATRIWTQAERQALFASVTATLDAGHQVIVIYPRKAVSTDEQADEDLVEQAQEKSLRKAAEGAYTLWEQCFPGRVVLSHGGLEEADNAAAMAAMREGRADILVATTVAEVGIDLPKVRRVTVVHPQYLGLTQLHQLRGRAARTGGEGWFDLYLPDSVSERSMTRLDALTRTDDGFRLAEMDLQLRGAGDLSRESERQWGADNTFLYGRPLRLDLMDAVLAQNRRA